MQEPIILIPVGVTPKKDKPTGLLPSVESKTDLTIKGEKLTWDFNIDWADQFELQLKAYLRSPRYKFPDHVKFAKNVLGLLEADRNNIEPILKELREKTNLNPYGRKKNPSWLYKFCELALNQHTLSKTTTNLTEALNAKFDSENEKLKSDLKTALKEKEDSRQSYETKLAEKQKEYTELNQTRNDEYNIIRRKYEDSLKAHEETKMKLTNAESREVHLTDQNKQLHAKNALLVSECSGLKEQIQSLRNTIDTEGQEHSATLIATKDQLAKATDDITKATQNYAKITAELALERTKITTLGDALAEANSKLHQVTRYYDLMKNWVNKLFGKSLGELPSDFIEKGKVPSLSPKKEIELLEIVARKDDVSEKEEKNDQSPEKNNMTFGKFFEDAKKRTQDAVQGAVTVTTEKLQSYTGSGPKT